MRWLLAVLLTTMAFSAWAIPPAPPSAAAPSALSVDPWIDAQLADLDRYGMRYRAAFDDELARYQDTPRDLIVELRKGGWSDGDLYAACVIARTAGRPCRVVADAWSADRFLRWDDVAGRFGVSAGSNALERMKLAIMATYKRSGRPLATLRIPLGD